MAESIYELTNHKYREIKYSNGISETAMYPFIERVCYCLRKLKLYSGQDTEQYTIELSKCVAQFQKNYDVGDKNGTLNDDTYNKLIAEADKIANDTVIGGDNNENNSDSTDSSGTDNIGAHYGQFFSEQNSKQFRQNKRDIRILLGDGTITKVIKDVYMRSVGVEVDSSGNPISETYEFIAKDVCETDNKEDLNKYTTIGEDYAPANFAIKYDFSSYTNPQYREHISDVYDETEGNYGVDQTKVDLTPIYEELTDNSFDTIKEVIDEYHSNPDRETELSGATRDAYVMQKDIMDSIECIYGYSTRAEVEEYMEKYYDPNTIVDVLVEHGLYDSTMSYEEMLAVGFFNQELDYLLYS